MPHRPRTPNFVALAQFLHIEDDTRHIKWVIKWISTHNMMYLPTESRSRLVCTSVPPSLNCWGLSHIDTHSVHLRVFMGPVCALTVPHFDFSYCCCHCLHVIYLTHSLTCIAHTAFIPTAAFRLTASLSVIWLFYQLDIVSKSSQS